MLPLPPRAHATLGGCDTGAGAKAAVQRYNKANFPYEMLYWPRENAV
jgi:hypothetical protein